MPRRPHKKSRYGCDNCRQRRVKCDEQGPPCANCVLRQLADCKFSRALPSRLLENAGLLRHEENLHGGPKAKAPDERAGLFMPSPGSSSGASAVDDLELMHHFSTETYRSLCISDSEIVTWQTLVPRLALKHRYLMHGILALASLHIASQLDTAEAVVYVDTGLLYYQMSLEPFRQAIAQLTPDNCDAVFAESVVLSAINLALSPLTATRHTASSMIEYVITAFELLQGVKKILTVGHSWIGLKLFSEGIFWTDRSSQLDEDTASALNELALINEISKADSGVVTSQYTTNADAINHLRYCFMKFACSADPAPILSWLAAVDTKFVHALQERSPFSLVILAHWGVLLCELHNRRWWARNTGRALLSELSDLLGKSYPEWKSSLNWVEKKTSAVETNGVEEMESLRI